MLAYCSYFLPNFPCWSECLQMVVQHNWKVIECLHLYHVHQNNKVCIHSFSAFNNHNLITISILQFKLYSFEPKKEGKTLKQLQVNCNQKQITLGNFTSFSTIFIIQVIRKNSNITHNQKLSSSVGQFWPSFFPYSVLHSIPKIQKCFLRVFYSSFLITAQQILKTNKRKQWIATINSAAYTRWCQK